MNTLKALFVCALFTVTGCAGIEPTEELDGESEELDGESDVAPAAVQVGGDTSDAKKVCWDDGTAYCCGSGGMICCLIEGQMYCG